MGVGGVGDNDSPPKVGDNGEKDRGNHGAGSIKGPESDDGHPAGGDKGGHREKWC